MSERQLNFIIALLCLNFAYDAVKLMITMYYDREDRIELNYRLDRLEEFLVRKTVVQCSCDCCDEDEEEAEEDTQEEAEEDTQEEADEEETQEADEEETQDEEETHEEDVDETQEEAFVGNDGAVYAYKISLNAEDDTRMVTKVEAVNDGVQTDA
jgi:hypothetical protein